MSFTEEGSRYAGDEDVCPCPKCGKRDTIIVKWSRSTNEEVIKVGCKACQLFEQSEEWSLAYVKWNLMVFDKIGNGGNDEMEKIHRLFFIKFTMAQEIKNIKKEIDEFVYNTYMPRIKAKIGDRFEAKYFHPGKWEIIDIEARYGINTGPIFVIKAVNLLDSGRQGNKIVEFWSDRMGKVKKLDDYVPATRWSMLIKNDECRLNNVSGIIIEVNYNNHLALIAVGASEVTIKSLRGVMVNKKRL